jgi:predicted permease
MSNVLLLVACLVVGVILRRFARLPEDGYRSLNAFIVNVSLPALVLVHIHDLRVDATLLFPMLMPWLVFGVGAALFLVLGRAGAIPRETAGALVLTSALGNTSFVGLPMIEAYYGRELLGVGLIADQLGTFMCLSVPGMVLAAHLSAGPERRAPMLRRMLLFPPFLAVLVAVALRPLPYPESLRFALERLGDTLTPLALVSAGFQLRPGNLGRARKGLAIGLLYKLVLAPALVLLVFGLVLGGRGMVFRVTVFEAAMPPMITGSIVAQEHALDRELCALMLGVGIPLSFLTLWPWYNVLQGF